LVLMLALRELSELSTLDEEEKSEMLLTWLSVMLAFTEVRELSTLEEEFEKELDEAL